MIEVRLISYRYGENDPCVLQEIDLSIEEGEYVALVGPNGCGKTTLIRHLNALLVPLQGDVLVDGMSTKDRRVLQQIRQRVGMVFGNPDNQIVGMTVEEDVAFGPMNLNLTPQEVHRRVEESLAAVRMSKYLRASPHELSEGEKQLVALAGVLAMNPKYLVLDEPTAYLDPSSRRRVLETLAGLNRQGMTIVHVTHDPEAMVPADRVLVMHEGKVLYQETLPRILARPEILRELGLGLPGVAEIMWRLKDMGLDQINPCVRSLEEACNQIYELLHAHARENANPPHTRSESVKVRA